MRESLFVSEKENLMEKWDDSNILDPKILKCGSHKKAYWKCKNGHVSYAEIKSVNAGFGCVYCQGKRASKENNLEVLRPELLKFWDYDKNKINPVDVCEHSHKKVWWVCHNGHEWEASVDDVSSGKMCPYCSNHRIGYGNSLLDTDEDLCKEWNYIKNTIRPEEVSRGSSKKVFWICKNGHEWSTPVYARTGTDKKHASGCPYCSNNIIGNENNLLYKNPTLCEEWDYAKNEKRPENLSPMSSYKAWWICKKCGNNWITSVGNRNGKNGTGCPICRKSLGEEKIVSILKDLNLFYTNNDRSLGLIGPKNYRLCFDFVIYKEETKQIPVCVIEYDGIYHFKKVFDKHDFEYDKEKDAIKNFYCQENNLPLIRIPYWEYKNIDSIVKHFLQESYYENYTE